jgi:hypothetical protein
MNKKEHKIVSIKKFLKQQINVNLLVVSLGISIFFVILKLILHENKLFIGLICVKWLQPLAKQFLHMNFSDRYHCIYIIIIGLCVLFEIGIFFLATKTNLIYTVWSIMTIVIMLLMIIWNAFNGILLISTMTWIFFTISWLIYRLYKWIVSNKATMLTKLTFIFCILLDILTIGITLTHPDLLVVDKRLTVGVLIAVIVAITVVLVKL